MPQETAKSRLKDQIDSMRILLRWVQHEGSIGSGHTRQKAKLELLAAALELNSRDQLNKFLSQTLNVDEEAKRYHALEKPLLQVLKDNLDTMPAALWPAVEMIYGSDAFDTDGERVVPKARIWMHRSLADVTQQDESVLEPLYGLSFILRSANEVVYGPDGSMDHGWSASLLNVVPPDVQRGLHHPLFKLRQRGKSRTAIDILGIVVAQRDRFVLEGSDDGEGRAFSAAVLITPDEWRKFRGEGSARGAIKSGVMLGLSSARSNFGGNFELVAVPRSQLATDANSDERNAFRRLYAECRDATGVRTLSETATALASVGITLDQEALKAMREASRQSPLLGA